MTVYVVQVFFAGHWLVESVWGNEESAIINTLYWESEGYQANMTKKEVKQ